MTITTQGQSHSKSTLVLQLPDSYKWTTEPFDEGDSWGLHYKGFVGDERYPTICFIQSSTPNKQLEMPIPQLAKQIGELVKSYDPTAKLQLRKKKEVEGDDCFLYSITGGETIFLLYYRQSNEITYSVEIELHADQLEQIPLTRWEQLFFSSLIAD